MLKFLMNTNYKHTITIETKKNHFYYQLLQNYTFPVLNSERRHFCTTIFLRRKKKTLLVIKKRTSIAVSFLIWRAKKKTAFDT